MNLFYKLCFFLFLGMLFTSCLTAPPVEELEKSKVIRDAVIANSFDTISIPKFMEAESEYEKGKILFNRSNKKSKIALDLANQFYSEVYDEGIVQCTKSLKDDLIIKQIDAVFPDEYADFINKLSSAKKISSYNNLALLESEIKNLNAQNNKLSIMFLKKREEISEIAKMHIDEVKKMLLIEKKIIKISGSEND